MDNISWIQNFLGPLLQFYRSLPAGIGGKGWVFAICMAIFFYFFILATERAYGTRTDNYRSRNFLHDIVYWMYLRSTLHSVLLFGLAGVLLSHDPKSLGYTPPFAHLPKWIQLILFLIFNDFVFYWWHRATHHFKFLWAFHAMHHSQQRLTFATGARFHPIETLAGNFVVVIPGLLLGFNGLLTLTLIVVLTIQAEIEHTQIPWRFGPLYWVLVSPVYHSYHHGVSAEYRDKHFSQTFVIWDHLFGTAVKRNIPPPTTFGVPDMNPKSFVETLVAPFRLLHQYYVARRI